MDLIEIGLTIILIAIAIYPFIKYAEHQDNKHDKN